MRTDFPRILALLRKEKKISQRVAANDLSVSQALLSHYENGLREPGIAFIIRAAEYYHVSCDYLLGRSFSRVGDTQKAAPEKTEIDLDVEQSQVLQSFYVLLDMVIKSGDNTLIEQTEQYFSLDIYKIYRCLYSASHNGMEAIFHVPADNYNMLCDAALKQQELKIKLAANKKRKESGNAHLIASSPKDIEVLFPEYAGAFLDTLQKVSRHLRAMSD